MDFRFHLLIITLWIVPETLSADCDETFTADRGFIQTPNYPEEYENYEDCTYKIESRAADQVVHLYFRAFYIEYGFDYLDIYQNFETTLDYIGFYTGEQTGEMVMGTGLVMLHFTSDYMVVKPGFYIEYVIFDNPCADPDENNCVIGFQGNECHYVKEKDYECICDNPGFMNDPDHIHSCIDRDECHDIDMPDTRGMCEHTCQNTYGGYDCSCYQGYQLLSNGFSCDDFNECANDAMLCKDGRLEYGRTLGICVNEEGTYHCECKEGYSWDEDDHVCKNIDECMMFVSPCEQECRDQSPEETGMRYECSCRDGYELHSNGQECVQLENCENYDPCEHTCYNGLNGIQCSCDAGYELDHDGVHCHEINECQMLHPCDHDCVNQVPELHAGMKYYCTCMDGYYLHADGHNCVDIDECADHLCEQTCYNMVGSYRCECRSGYYMDSTGHCIREYDDHDDCDSMSYRCKHGGWCVSVVSGMVRCGCPSGYSGYDCSVSDDDDESSTTEGLTENTVIIIIVFSLLGAIILVVVVILVSWKCCNPNPRQTRRIRRPILPPSPPPAYPTYPSQGYQTYIIDSSGSSYPAITH